MSNTVPQPAPDPSEAAVDPRVAHAEERRLILREVTDLTLAVMRAVGRNLVATLDAPPAAEPAATGDKAVAAPRRDPEERLNRLASNIRLTVSLEAKLEAGLVAYLAGETVKAEAARERAASAADDPDAPANDPYAPLRTGRKARVRELLTDVIDREIDDIDDYDDALLALDERLLQDEAYRDLEHLPLREIVERLCADLKLKPDWRRWTGEGWKIDPFTRPRCSPWNRPSRVPVLDDLDDPDPLE